MTSYSLSTLNPKLDYIGDNPAITEKTIKIYKDRLQTKPDAFGNEFFICFCLNNNKINNK